MARRFLGTTRSYARLVGAGILLVSLTSPPAAAQNQLWVEQFGTSQGEGIAATVPDGSGGVYVYSVSGGTMDLTRFDSAGAQQWIQTLTYTILLGGPEVAAPDDSGGVFVSFDRELVRFDGAGSQLWSRPFICGGTPSCAAKDGAGGVYVYGYSMNCNYPWLTRFDSAGNQLWAKISPLGSSKAARAAAPDGSGGVYFTGYYSQSSGRDALLTRFDSTGAKLWQHTFGPTAMNENSEGVDVAQDGSGGVYVAGWTDGDHGGANAGREDAWLARYDAAGNEMWIRQWGTEWRDIATATVADGVGGVYVSGDTYGSLGGPHAGHADAWLARYDGSGRRLWIQQLGTTDLDHASAAASDGRSGLYVSGETNGSLGGPNAGGTDIWLAHYDSTCPTPESYCVASTTSIPGCQAAIAGIGTPSFADPTSFTISSGSVPGGNIGICFFGDHGRASTPFGTLGGQICVQGPVFRSKPRLSGGSKGNCDGVFNFTLQDLIDQSPIVFAGAILNAEIWARDPANADGYLLSDGLEFTVCP